MRSVPRPIATPTGVSVPAPRRCSSQASALLRRSSSAYVMDLVPVTSAVASGFLAA